ncbi:hypothetical protein P7K49_007954 [Saguinus oedipus]|uniref:Immunoglobulin V-set domain-containing protein n=1 Tax=Saguinus oedipus TaxID=9490 RepID=A0ABQ9VW96_SAGOE|nr:hypothetical protein P7K49_007954 [Saguinus oedipus]
MKNECDQRTEFGNVLPDVGIRISSLSPFPVCGRGGWVPPQLRPGSLSARSWVKGAVPKELHRYSGQTLFLQCWYSPETGSYQPKSWCEQTSPTTCTLLITTSKTQTAIQQSRYKISDEPNAGFFNVTMNQLHRMTQDLTGVDSTTLPKPSSLFSETSAWWYLQEDHHVLMTMGGYPQRGVHMEDLAHMSQPSCSLPPTTIERKVSDLTSAGCRDLRPQLPST